jgi:hypothetical protein
MERHTFFALAVCAITCCAPCVSRGDLIYNIVDHGFGSTTTMTGQITTDGTLGDIALGNHITSWNITFTVGFSQVTVTAAGGPTAGVPSLVGDVEATPTSIYIPTVDAIGEENSMMLSPDDHSATIIWRNEWQGTSPGQIFQDIGILAAYPADGWNYETLGQMVFTVATAAAVPEPSAALVAVFGAVAFIAYGWSRHRRERRRQGAA